MEQLPAKPHVTKAREHFNKGRESYIGFCVELAAAYREGEATQEELGVEFDMERRSISNAIAVGNDERIASNTSKLPNSQHALYLLTTLPDDAFEELAKPDTTQAKIKEWKAAQQPPKPKAIPAPAPTPEPEQPEEQEMKKFDTGVIMIQTGLVKNGGHSKLVAVRKEMRERFGDGIFETAAKFRAACVQFALMKNPDDAEKAQQDADESRRQLPDSWQKKFDKALAARIEIEIADMHKQFDEQLREAREQLEIKLQEAEAERQAAFQYRLGIDSHMTMDEFKLVRSCLHPDRAPEDQRDKFNKAFSIFNRLEKTVNTKAPISILRRHGWEKASPFYKAP